MQLWFIIIFSPPGFFLWNTSVFWYSFILLSPLHSMSDQHLISPHSNTAESFIKVMKIKEMMSNLRSFDCQQILLASTKENL